MDVSEPLCPNPGKVVTAGGSGWPGGWVTAALLAGALLLSWPAFMPSVDSVGSFDEAYYINNSRLMLEGRCPELTAIPAVTTFYAILQLPLRHCPLWLILAASVGHLVIVILFWWASLRVACELSASPIVTAFILFVLPLWPKLLENSSDGLYVGLSGLALAHVLAFLRRHKLGDLRSASAIAGIAALTRNDGLILIPVLATFILARRPKTLGSFKALFLAVVPACLVVGPRFLFSAASGKGIRVGIARRTYDAFEQGKGVAHAEFVRRQESSRRGLRSLQVAVRERGRQRVLCHSGHSAEPPRLRTPGEGDDPPGSSQVLSAY